MQKRYACFGGHVTSRHDGDWHYISAHRVCQLYRVPPAECIFIDENTPSPPASALTGLIALHPRSDGDYTALQEAQQ